MKNFLFSTSLLMFAVAFAFCQNTSAATVVGSSSEEVSNLSSTILLDQLTLSWDIKDTSNVGSIQILKRESSTLEYNKVSDLNSGTTTFKANLPAFLSFDFAVRLLFKDGSLSASKQVLNVIGGYKSVVLDSCGGRRMQIYLPPSYGSSSKRYPVAYIHDGQNLFVTTTAPNGIWKICECMDELLKNGQVEEMIIVGLYNTPQRDQEYVPYDSERHLAGKKSMAKDYAKFVANTILPYIDGKYRTLPTRENRAVMGSSYGGVFSLWMIQNYDNLFSMAGLLSPSLFVGNGQIGNEIAQANKKDIKLWIDMGTKEWWNMDVFLQILQQKGYNYGSDFVYLEGVGDEHNEQAWSKRVSNAFIMFKGKKATQITDFQINVEAVDGWTLENLNSSWRKNKFIVINPILKMDNGMSYSLNRFAQYEVVNPRKGSISENGIFQFKSKEDVEIIVKYNNRKETVVVSYAQLQDQLKLLK